MKDMAFTQFDRTLLFILIGSLAPSIGIVCFALAERRRRRKLGVKPPQSEKLLRPPGHSLAVKLDELNEGILTTTIWSALWCAGAAACVDNSVKLTPTMPVWWVQLMNWAIPVCFAIPGVVCAHRAHRMLLQQRNIKLGLRGEQATAEALHEVSGFRVFHDIQAGENWNIDHAIVGPKGVFVIETKARCRRGPNPLRELEAHQFRVEGKNIILPYAVNSEAIPQAQRNAHWLADALSKATAEPVFVQPLVVVPGWFVVDPKEEPVPAMGSNYLKGYLRRQTDRLSPAQVERIVRWFEDKNRTVEF